MKTFQRVHLEEGNKDLEITDHQTYLKQLMEKGGAGHTTIYSHGLYKISQMKKITVDLQGMMA